MKIEKSATITLDTNECDMLQTIAGIAENFLNDNTRKKNQWMGYDWQKMGELATFARYLQDV